MNGPATGWRVDATGWKVDGDRLAMKRHAMQRLGLGTEGGAVVVGGEWFGSEVTRWSGLMTVGEGSAKAGWCAGLTWLVCGGGLAAVKKKAAAVQKWPATIQWAVPSAWPTCFNAPAPLPANGEPPA